MKHLRLFSSCEWEREHDVQEALETAGKLVPCHLHVCWGLTLCVCDEATEEHWSQDRALRDATHHWPPLRHRATDLNSLSLSRECLGWADLVWLSHCSVLATMNSHLELLNVFQAVFGDFNFFFNAVTFIWGLRYEVKLTRLCNSDRNKLRILIISNMLWCL